MRTVFPNPKALLYTIFVVGGILFLVFLIYDQNQTLLAHTGKARHLGRDLKAREKEIIEDKVRFSSKKPPKNQANDEVTTTKKFNASLLNEQFENDLEILDTKEEVSTQSMDSETKQQNGANELKPISRQTSSQPIFGGPAMAATIIDSADTLFIVGLTERYEEARDFIRDNFDIHKNAISSLSVFEITIRYVGAFLSLYSLTGERFYIDKAVQVADALLPAFDTPSGLPNALIDPLTNSSANFEWAPQKAAILSEVGSLHLEFVYLSNITGNPIYKEKVQHVRNVLEKQAQNGNGLYPIYISTQTGKFISNTEFSLGAYGDSFYEYLIKSWIQTNYTDWQALTMYTKTSKAIQKNLLLKSEQSRLSFIGDLSSGYLQRKMSHLACYVPGMFALEASIETDPEQKVRTMSLADELGRTCHESYARTTTGLGPEFFHFDSILEAQPKARYFFFVSDKWILRDMGYALRPESIESWFYLWRLTQNKKYKDWIWNAIEAIDKHCRMESGFTGIVNGYDDIQQTFFIAETLKYAYLAFDDTKIPLDKWVFNTEAHPFLKF